MGYLFGVYEIRENMVNHHKMMAFRCLVWVSGSGGVVVLVG